MQTVVNAVHKVTWHRGVLASADRTVGGREGLLARLVPFVSTTKNFRAERRYPVRYDGPVGRLGEKWTERIRRDNPVYVAYSYQTPIAWVDWMGHVVIVPMEETDGGRTQTTQTHVASVRVWLGSGLCEHGRLLPECMAVRAGVEWKYRNGELPPGHGERWID